MRYEQIIFSTPKLLAISEPNWVHTLPWTHVLLCRSFDLVASIRTEVCWFEILQLRNGWSNPNQYRCTHDTGLTKYSAGCSKMQPLQERCNVGLNIKMFQLRNACRHPKRNHSTHCRNPSQDQFTFIFDRRPSSYICVSVLQALRCYNNIINRSCGC